MPFLKRNKNVPSENDAAEINENTSASENHRDAVSPAERAIIEAASGNSHTAGNTPSKARPAKYSYLNAPILRSRPCPLCGEFLEEDTIFCPKCKNRVASRYDEAMILKRQGKSPAKEEKKTGSTAPKKADAPVAEKKAESAAPKKAVAPVAEKKAEPAAPKKADAPVAEKKAESTAPKKADAPVAEKKAEPAAPKKAVAPVAEKKAEPAAPKKADAPVAEKKHEPKVVKAPANLVIKVKGSGFAKPAVNSHFTAADDFDD
ncbi:MAG: hypothetical protein K6B38_00990 [Ruminococcus sp.]|nr:hypothetical protein [Ruminococcus sp.]